MNFSDPPVNPTVAAGRPTFADVAMRLVSDGPVYAIILIAGVLAMRGTATTLEALVGVMGALLSKSWPRPVQIGTHVLIFVLLGARLAFASPW